MAMVAGAMWGGCGDQTNRGDCLLGHHSDPVAVDLCAWCVPTQGCVGWDPCGNTTQDCPTDAFVPNYALSCSSARDRETLLGLLVGITCCLVVLWPLRTALRTWGAAGALNTNSCVCVGSRVFAMGTVGGTIAALLLGVSPAAPPRVAAALAGALQAANFLVSLKAEMRHADNQMDVPGATCCQVLVGMLFWWQAMFVLAVVTALASWGAIVEGGLLGFRAIVLAFLWSVLPLPLRWYRRADARAVLHGLAVDDRDVRERISSTYLLIKGVALIALVLFVMGSQPFIAALHQVLALAFLQMTTASGSRIVPAATMLLAALDVVLQALPESSGVGDGWRAAAAIAAALPGLALLGRQPAARPIYAAHANPGDPAAPADPADQADPDDPANPADPANAYIPMSAAADPVGDLAAAAGRVPGQVPDQAASELPADPAEAALQAADPTKKSDVPMCAVCFDPLAGAVRALPCAHCFHEACIAEWTRDCPICRGTQQFAIHVDS